jgi:cysteine synthase A
MGVSGDVLLVSQFTLYGFPKGNKPDFHLAQNNEPALILFNQFVQKVKNQYKGGNIQTGKFGANMQVEIINDGPVTMTLHTDDLDLSKERAKIDKAKAKYGPKGTVASAAAASLSTGVVSDSSVTPSSSPAPALADDSIAAASATVTAVASPSPSASSPSESSPAASPTPSSASPPPATSPVTATVTAPVSAAASHTPSPASNGVGKKASSIPSKSKSSSSSQSSSSSDFASLVGNTSLIRLRGISESTGCNIYAKAEYENPGGSIKDRPACAIIDAAEKNGDLVRGEPGWIVEGTAGNTGLGLALVGASRGYRTLVVLADNNSEEKKQALRAVGAVLIEVPMVPFKNPNNFVHVAQRIYERMRDEFSKQSPIIRVILADQWSNEANRNSHMLTTGPEIWKQTNGKIDAFCCGVGTGGTLSGVSLYLRTNNPKIQSVLIDPLGSSLKNYFEIGELKTDEERSIAEGIGQGRLPDNLIRNEYRPDYCIHITDNEALPIAYDLLQYEGISIGTSSCINVAGAYKLAKQLGPGHTIVTILADSGNRYTSKLSNPEFLKSKSLPIPSWLDNENEQTKQIQQMANEFLKQSIVEVPPA